VAEVEAGEEAMSEPAWVSVTDDQPTDGEAYHVVVADRDGHPYNALASRPMRPQDCDVPLREGWKLWYFNQAESLEHLTVTHWRPLPLTSELPRRKSVMSRPAKVTT
jgi:hypothetical protein